MKKKLFTLLLTFCLALSVIPHAFAARIQLGDSGTRLTICKPTELQPQQIGPSNQVGIYLKTADCLRNIQVTCPSFNDNIGSLKLTLYKWKNSYEDTVAGTPISSKTYVDFTDGQTLKVSVPIDVELTGEFLCVLSDGVQNVGVWRDKNSCALGSDFTEPGSTKFFIDGNEISGGILSFAVTAPPSQKAQDTSEIKTKDAYSRIYANEADGYDGGWYSERSDEDNVTTVPYFGGINTGSYLYFGKVDFGKVSPKGFRQHIFNQGCYSNIGETQVVLDNKLGYPIAKTTVICEGYERAWETTTAVINENITGVHDVYLIFRGSEFVTSWFEFTKDVPEKSVTDLRLENYKNTPAAPPFDYMEDTWAASDMLGRKLPDNSQVGDPRDGRQTGLFYHSWRWVYTRTFSPVFDVTKIQRAYDGNPDDIKNDLAYPYWGPTGNIHFWNESVYGYYTGFDDWVVRKQLELFSAADIDAIFYDLTNSNLTFAAGFMSMAKEIHNMKTKGIDAPQISFITPFQANDATVTDIRLLYDNMYSIGLYEDAWFRWQNKPLLMSYPALFNVDCDYEDINKQNAEILDFFTFRPCQPSYWYGSAVENQWPWLEVAPQHPFVRQKNGRYECMAVGTAQNTNDGAAKGTHTAMNGENVFGRSYTYANKFALLDDVSCYMGYNFQEQWDNAIAEDPDFIFITGWNEGFANRYEEHEGVKGAIYDTYDNEHSRDIEPILSDFKDTYYLLMVKNIRRYKGVQKTPVAGEKVTVDIDGNFDVWNNVTPTYYDYVGLPDRNGYKSGRMEKYVNTTGRNDFKTAKVARDDENLYFFVETEDSITPYTDDAWMRLFINSDRTQESGWEGYDFALNIESASSNTAVLSKSTGFWEWEKVADVEYRVSGNKMMVKIPRNLIFADGSVLDFEFKWADNMQTNGNLMEDFYNNGDTAPVARFNYRFVETEKQAGIKAKEEFIYPSRNIFDKMRDMTVLKIDTPFALTEDGAVAIDSTNSAVTPVVVNDRTFVPIRFVTEKLGASAIEWDAETSTATVSYFYKKIKIQEGSNEIKVDDAVVPMDVAAFTMNDRLYIPLRAVSEALGNVEIYWEDPCYVFIGNKYTTGLMKDGEVRKFMNYFFN